MVSIIAHRGFSGKYPENTLLAIRKAVELGVDWVEIDVWLSLDQRIIVIHDKKLSRTTNGKGKIMWKTLREIRKYHTKKHKQQIPVLEEVFPLITRGTELNIELKNMWLAWPVAQLIKKHKMQDKVLVSSGSISALRIVKQVIPSLRTAYIFYISNNQRLNYFITSISKLTFRLTQYIVLFLAKFANVNNVHLSYPFATKYFIKNLHKKGYVVNVWTVNTKALMKKLIKRKADGIITDCPNKLKQVLREKPKTKRGLIRLRPRKR